MAYTKMDYSREILVERYPILQQISSSLDAARDLTVRVARSGGTFLVAGNGGSSADSEHIVGELMKSFVRKRPIIGEVAKQLTDQAGAEGAHLAAQLEGAIPAICLSSHQSLSTAFMNDVDPALVYAQQVYGYGRSGDLFWGISTSGNAKNVRYAALVAKAKGMFVLGMTGEDGGALFDLCDVCIRVPQRETFMVQELHLPVYHWLCMELEASFW